MCETLKNTFVDTRIRERHRGRGRGRGRGASVASLAGMHRKMTRCALTSNLPTYNAYVHFLVLLLHLRVRQEQDKAVSPDRLSGPLSLPRRGTLTYFTCVKSYQNWTR